MGKIMVKGVTYGGGDCANQNLASEFSESSTYAVDDYVIYQDDLYKCTTAVSTAGSWDNTKWTRAQITDEMGGSSVSTLEDLTDVDITNPTANDTIKWNPTTQKWENGAGGGTGDVADVYVNGQSVLDSNKIAQIKSYKEVTQAEYDALPASKESDDVLYCITDQATADTTVAPIIYSEEEREVGVWTDGKPLYQKTYRDSYTNPGTGSHSTNHDLPGVITQVIPGYIRYEYQGEVYYLIGSQMNSYLQITIPGIPSPTYFVATQTVGGVTQTDIYYTVQYIKETDTPGSGKYAPSGVPAVHYSTDEQVIGTWIDGSTIYERSINLGSFSVSSDGEYTIEATPEIDTFLGYEGYAVENSIKYILQDPGIRIKINNNNLIFQCSTGSSWNVSEGYIIIRYTKTSS